MIDGIYLSTAGGLVQEAKQSVIANNVANANTPGFKKQSLVFETRLAEALSRDRSLPRGMPLTSTGGNWIAESVTNFSQGALSETANPLDLAIQGEGFFTVTDGREVFYTRAGTFALDAQSRLTSADGKYLVLDEGGRPIVVEGEEINITRDGKIFTRTAGEVSQAGKLSPVTFKELQERAPGLSKIIEGVGDGNLRYKGSQVIPADGAIRQGFIEQSTVNIVEEMAAMIQCYRAFEANMQAIRAQDSALQKAVTQVGRATPR